MQLGLLLFAGQKGGRRLSQTSKARRSGHVLRRGWQGLPDHARVMASDFEAFLREHRGDFCAPLLLSTSFFLAKNSCPTAKQKPALSDLPKKCKLMGKKSQCFRRLLRCSFCTVCSLICLGIHLLFLSCHPSLPFPKQESDKYVFCPLNYFRLKLELTLADPAAAEPQHFPYRILPVKFIGWCSITLIKMQ